MNRTTRVVAVIIMAVLLVFNFIWALPVNAAQYGTNFKFKDLKEMQDDGWTISHPEGVTLRSDGIVLDGSKGVTTIAYAHNIPSGVKDWKVGATGAWLGGGGHSWLDVQVYTQSHTYVYALDGASAQYVLLRDNAKVIGVEGYREAANSQVQIYLEKTGSSITISYNSQIIKTYTENDSSPVTGVAISSPASSAALYTWAGAFIPEPSAAGPTGDTTTEPVNPTTEPAVPNPTEPTMTPTNPTAPNSNNNQDWLNYDTTDLSGISSEFNTISGIQDNPGSSIDFTTLDPNSQILDPPLPPTGNEQTGNQNTNPGPTTTTTAAQNPNQPIWVVVLDGTFSINTDQPKVNATGRNSLAYNLLTGIALMQDVHISNGSAQFQAIAQNEQDMFEAGLLDPRTHQANYHFCNYSTPNYYVSINTHISGTPQTEQSAVAIITYQVTDANGQVIYQNKIQVVGSQGHPLPNYYNQAAQDINAYLQGIINRPLQSSSGP